MAEIDITSLPVDQQHLIRRAGEHLAAEFVGTFGRETIERLLADSLARLLPAATVTTYLPLLTERFARERLQALARIEHLNLDRRPMVLFVCTHNAGRSQMAAGWLRHVAGDTIAVFSGGSEPVAEINPIAVTAMAEIGIDITAEFPKPWTDEVVQAADVVITMGCGDACPLYPGKRYEDWDLPDPAGQSLEVVREVRDRVGDHVDALLASLASHHIA